MQPILARNASAVTPHDTNANVFNALWIGGAGVVKVDTLGGQSAVSFTCVAGSVLPVAVTRVYATDTTATLIVGLSW